MCVLVYVPFIWTVDTVWLMLVFEWENVAVVYTEDQFGLKPSHAPIEGVFGFLC